MILSIFAISGFVNAIASFILGILVIKKEPSNQIYRSFFIMCLAVVVWGAGYGFWLSSGTLDEARLWIYVLNLGSIFIPIFYFQWILTVLNLIEKKRFILTIGYFLTFGFALLSFSPVYILGFSQKGIFPYWPNGSIYFLLYILFFIGFFVYSFWLQIKKYQILADSKRFQLNNVLMGSAIGFLGGLTNFPLWFDIEIPPVGNFFVFVYALMFAYSIIRYRLMDIRVIFKKSLIDLLSLAVILGFVAYLILLLEQFSNKIFEVYQNLSTAIVAVIIGFSFPALHAFSKKIVDRFIDRDLDFGLEADLMMGSVINSDQVRSLTFEAAKEIEKHLNVDQITLLVRDHRFETFVSEYPEQFKIRIPIDHDFVNFVSCVDRVFETAQLEKFASIKTGTGKHQIGKFVRILKKHHAEMVAPIIGEGGMVGIVFLPKKRNGAAFEKEEKQWLGLYLRSVEEKLTPILLAQDFQAFSKNPVESINFGGKVEYDG